MTAARIVDTTLTAVWRGATSPLDRDAVALLANLLPVDAPRVAGAVPIVAPGAFGHEALVAAAHRAKVLEPLDDAALATLALIDFEPNDPPIIVHPEPIQPAPAPPAHAETPWSGRGVIWEHRLILPAAQDPAHTPQGSDAHASLSQLVARVLGRLARADRLRVEDPHGVLDLAAATALARHPDAARLTVAPSDTRGIATAVAQTMLAAPEGPAVVATLLGRAPRGAAAIEHLVTPHDRPRLDAAVEALVLTTDRPVPPEHPHWGRHASDRRLVHPDRLADLVRDHLEQWDITLTTSEHDHLMHTLRGRLRPGDKLDGPTLWATLATITDLAQRARGIHPPEAHP